MSAAMATATMTTTTASMTMTASEFPPVIIYAMCTVVPALAFLYEVTVIVFYSFWREIEFMDFLRAIIMRMYLVVVSAAVAYAAVERDMPLLPVGLFATIATSSSVYMITRVRIDYVEGHPPQLMDGCMKDKVVLVTGANSGIGRETVRQLATLGATVILACRNERRAQEAIDDVKATLELSNAGKPPSDQLRFLEMDLSDLASVRKAAKTFLAMKLPLHCLINNAGIMMGTQRKTRDGMETMMQANHFGHFLLTMLLLPKLQATKGSTLITLTSSTYKLSGKSFDFDDMFCEKGRSYTMFSQYQQTKLANILFATEFARRYPDIPSFAVHPGLVRTNVVSNMEWYMRYPDYAFGYIIALLQKTPPQGAYTTVYCAASDDPPPSGSYLVNSQVVPLNKHAENKEVRLVKRIRLTIPLRRHLYRTTHPNPIVVVLVLVSFFCFVFCIDRTPNGCGKSVGRW